MPPFSRPSACPFCCGRRGTATLKAAVPCEVVHGDCGNNIREGVKHALGHALARAVAGPLVLGLSEVCLADDALVEPGHPPSGGADFARAFDAGGGRVFGLASHAVALRSVVPSRGSLQQREVTGRPGPHRRVGLWPPLCLAFLFSVRCRGDGGKTIDFQRFFRTGCRSSEGWNPSEGP